MSVVVVKTAELCNECAKKSHPEYECAWGTLRVFIEMNDLCTDCLGKTPSVVVRYPFNTELDIVKRVEKSSPWLRRDRRRAWWNGFKRDAADPYVHLLLVTVLLVAALGLAAAIGVWSWLQ